MDSVEKKPMNGSLASRIRKNLSFIEEDVDTNDLITSLIADGIIDFNDKELISKAGTKKERAIYLVSLLMSRGDRAYDCFLEALRKAKYTHIVDKVSDVSIRNRETSDLGAGASHENLVSVPLEKKVANLEGQMLIHKEKIKSLSERLDKVETKEELKIIQQEVNNLQNVEAEKEQEIEKLKSQVQKKEDELSSLAEKTSAQVRQLETEIASLKEKAKIGENELQQYKQDKAELEKKLQALLLSTEEEFRKIKEEANASNAKIRELEDSRQKDAKAHDAKIKKLADSHDAKIKQLEESQQKILLMLQSMSQGPNNQSPQQPAPDACSPQVPKPAPAPVPSNEHSIKPTEPNIKDSKSGQQTSTGPGTQHAELKSQGPSTQGPHQPKTDASSRQVLKTLRVPLPIIPTPEAEILGPNSVRQQKPSAGPSKLPTEPKAQVSKAPRAQLSLKEPYIQLPGPKDSNQKEKPY